MFEYRQIFSERLRSRRNKLCLTQEQLAVKSGLHVAAITHFEAIKGTHKPSFFNIIKLAKALNVTSDYLLGLSNEQ